jgi:predicted HAD superfamily hydrolase
LFIIPAFSRVLCIQSVATPEPKNPAFELRVFIDLKRSGDLGEHQLLLAVPQNQRFTMLVVKSFDIFETLVTRPFGSPQKVFPLVAASAKRNHNISIESRLFERERVLAEKRARKKTGKPEVTIEDIYAEFQSIFKLSNEEIGTLITCEIKLEIELCRPICSARALLEKARREGSRIVFLSDMYLPGSALHAILIRNACWQDGDHLYVSCEVGATKRTGEMFRHLLESESISAEQMIHIGNHPHSDVEVPRRLGIAVEPFFQGNLNARESQLMSTEGFDTQISGLLAGCSRLARLGNTEENRQHQKLREIAACTAGPFLSAFVLWVLRTANSQGLKRLYFISRDGFILLKIAKELAASVDSKIELRYLYGSRQAWHFPASRGNGLEKASWVWEWTTSYSVATVLSRVGLTLEAVGMLLKSEGIPPGAWNEPMSQKNEAKLKRIFLDPEFKKVLQREAENQRVLFVSYLKQEGLFSRVEHAIVDVGWNGNLQDSLGIILEEEGYPPVRGFYVGLNYRGNRKETGTRKAYLFDLRDDPKWRLPIPQPQSCIETFCAANHGSTIRYRAETGTICSVLQGWDTEPLKTWGLEVFQTVVTEYAAELAKFLFWVDNFYINPLLAARSLASTWSNPTLEEAGCLGSFPFLEDQVGTGAKPLARPLPWRHFARIIQSKYSKSYRVIWMEGCLRLTPEPRSSLLRLANYAKNAIRCLLIWKIQNQSLQP